MILFEVNEPADVGYYLILYKSQDGIINLQQMGNCAKPTFIKCFNNEIRHPPLSLEERKQFICFHI